VRDGAPILSPHSSAQSTKLRGTFKDTQKRTRRGLKNAVHPSTKLRTNGGWIEMIGEFPFVLRLSKHEVPFFSNLLA